MSISLNYFNFELAASIISANILDITSEEIEKAIEKQTKLSSAFNTTSYYNITEAIVKLLKKDTDNNIKFDKFIGQVRSENKLPSFNIYSVVNERYNLGHSISYVARNYTDGYSNKVIFNPIIVQKEILNLSALDDEAKQGYDLVVSDVSSTIPNKDVLNSYKIEDNQFLFSCTILGKNFYKVVNDQFDFFIFISTDNDLKNFIFNTYKEYYEWSVLFDICKQNGISIVGFQEYLNTGKLKVIRQLINHKKELSLKTFDIDYLNRYVYVLKSTEINKVKIKLKKITGSYDHNKWFNTINNHFDIPNVITYNDKLLNVIESKCNNYRIATFKHNDIEHFILCHSAYTDLYNRLDTGRHYKVHANQNGEFSFVFMENEDTANLYNSTSVNKTQLDRYSEPVTVPIGSYSIKIGKFNYLTYEQLNNYIINNRPKISYAVKSNTKDLCWQFYRHLDVMSYDNEPFDFYTYYGATPVKFGQNFISYNDYTIESDVFRFIKRPKKSEYSLTNIPYNRVKDNPVYNNKFKYLCEDGRFNSVVFDFKPIINYDFNHLLACFIKFHDTILHDSIRQYQRQPGDEIYNNEFEIFTIKYNNIIARVSIKFGSNGALRTYINDQCIKRDEINDALLSISCFDNQKAYDNYLTSIGKISLLGRNLIDKGIKLSFNNAGISVKLIIEIDKEGSKWFAILRDIKGKVIKKLMLSGAINTLTSKFHKSEFITMHQEDLFLSINSSKLISIISLFQNFSIKDLYSLINVSSKLYDLRLLRSRKLLADVVKMTKATYVKEKYTGYLVKGKSGQQYMVTCNLAEVSKDSAAGDLPYFNDHGTQKMGQILTYPNFNYVCVVDKSKDQAGYDQVASRLLALYNDTKVVKEITTLGKYVNNNNNGDENEDN